MSRKMKKHSVQKQITAKDLEKTYFVPMKRMNEVIDIVETPTVYKPYSVCDYSLMKLKHERSTRECFDECVERYSSARHMSLLVSACYKALYAHDWDRLLCILRRVPKWKIRGMETFHARVLTVLLMYHPDSQAKGFLNEYIHMVWGCRTDQDKKAIQKVLLTLNKQMPRTIAMDKLWLQSQEQRRKAFLEMNERKGVEEEMDDDGCEK